MSDHDMVQELTEAVTSLARLVRNALDERRGRRCFVYGDHVARHGTLGVGLLVVVSGEVVGSLSACLPLARAARKHPSEAARKVLGALARGCVPSWAQLGLGFDDAPDLRGLPEELLDLAGDRRHVARRPDHEARRNA
ncbi:hypothetical protein, partial [Deinococcus pimensis]|uniref:hypothetical protein n=1 Tax=Deinococcus pimensis TaxID=309888 RepID=UPI000482333B